MQPIPPPLHADPEFRPMASERALPPVVDPASYRRMLFNPFLGIVGVLSWMAAIRWIWIAAVDTSAGFVFLLVGTLAIGVFLPRLFHYHCLDCGRTGRISRWRQHICPAVARRILEGRPLRFRTPGPLVQMLLLGYLLAAALVLLSYSGLTSR